MDHALGVVDVRVLGACFLQGSVIERICLNHLNCQLPTTRRLSGWCRVLVVPLGSAHDLQAKVKSALLDLRAELLLELLVVDQDTVQGRAVRNKMRHEVLIAKLFGQVHLQDIVQFLVGHVAVVLLVDLANSPHHVCESILASKHIDEVVPRDLLHLFLLPEEDAVIATTINDILLPLMVKINILIELLHGLRQVYIVQPRDVQFQVLQVRGADERLV